MRAPKNVRRLHGNGCQLVDVEKAAIVDLVERCSPVTKAICLLIEQPVHGIDRRGIIFVAVVAGDISFDMPADRLTECGQVAKAALDDFLLALPLADRRQIAGRLRRQMSHGGDDAFQLN